MTEKKMHYFEFHFQKFIAATKGWKDDEVGAFVKLLIEQFDNGFIPDDPLELERLITTYKKNWPRLKKKFTEPSDPGQLRSTFMRKVRAEAHEKSAKNAENGAKGGKAKKANAIANGIANAERTGKRIDSQPVTSNQEPKEEKIEKEIFDHYPGPFTEMILSEQEGNAAIEFVFRLTQALLTADRLNDFWRAFVLNLTGEKFYEHRAELMRHFRNWLKDQKLDAPLPVIQESGKPILSAREKRDQQIYAAEFGQK